MGKRFQLTESDKEQIQKLYLIEQSESEKDDRKFCHGGNVKSLEEIVGEDEADDYIDGVQLRKNGINALVDRMELLKTLRLHPKIDDGGEHLAYDVMNHLKSYKPYNYFDETKKECNKAMDKIIELYKENEHGEELVRDIEKVYALSNVSARAKEFLKHGMDMIKGQ
jgi:Mor family transcriptional regulator